MVEDAVEAFDCAWLLPPQQGELFDNPKALPSPPARLCIAPRRCGRNYQFQKDRARFACIHHGAETRNWRGLEEYIKRDAEGNILKQSQEGGHRR